MYKRQNGDHREHTKQRRSNERRWRTVVWVVGLWEAVLGPQVGIGDGTKDLTKKKLEPGVQVSVVPGGERAGSRLEGSGGLDKLKLKQEKDKQQESYIAMSKEKHKEAEGKPGSGSKGSGLQG